MKVRIADEHDLSTIVDIYNEAIAIGGATADLQPITVDSRLHWFRSHEGDNYAVYVAEIEKKVIGWCSLSPYRPGRKALRHTAEISFYISQEHGRQGVASMLIDHAINNTKRLELTSLIAIILDTNLESIQLMEKFYFEIWGRLPNVALINGKECGHIYMGKRVNK